MSRGDKCLYSDQTVSNNMETLYNVYQAMSGCVMSYVYILIVMTYISMTDHIVQYSTLVHHQKT